MAHELAGLRTGAGPSGAVHDVVETELEQTEQVLTRGALLTHGLLVGVAELTLEHAVDGLGLLLLLELGEVLAAGVAAAGTAVRTGREGTTVERLAALLVLVDVDAEATRDAHLRAGVASHV